MRMDSRIKSRWSRMPHGVLGMVLIVIAVENTLAKHSDLITDLMPATWKYSATKAHKDARSAQILCFGSSLVKCQRNK